MKKKMKKKDPVRVGVVGLGIGVWHLDAYRECESCEITAICDAAEKRLHEIGDEYKIKERYTSFEKMLSDGKIDAVSIAVPNVLHHPMALAALEAGVHVLCEKPLAMNAAQGREMVEKAEAKNLRLAVHYNTRLSPQHQIVRVMYEAGEFGTIRHIRAGWVRQRGIPSWGAGWFLRKDQAGGGVLIDLGVHMIDAALWACGFPKVLTVTGQTHRAFAEKDAPGGLMDVDDFTTAYLRCEGGTTIAIELIWAGHPREREESFCSVFGDEAGAHWRHVRAEPEWQRILEITRRGHGTLMRTEITEFPKTSRTVQSDFVEAILEGREPLCSGRQGLALMEILDAIYQSSETGREVCLNEPEAAKR